MRTENELRKEAMDELIKEKEDSITQKEKEIENLTKEIIKIEILDNCDWVKNGKLNLDKINQDKSEINKKIISIKSESETLKHELKVLKGVKEQDEGRKNKNDELKKMLKIK